jgi:hypothetical protein
MTPTKPTTGGEVTEADLSSSAKILVLRLQDDIPEPVLERGWDECRAWCVENYPLIHEEYAKLFAAHRAEACRAAVAEAVKPLVELLEKVFLDLEDETIPGSNRRITLRQLRAALRQHAQPPAQQEATEGWINVSDRLPEKEDADCRGYVWIFAESFIVDPDQRADDEEETKFISAGWKPQLDMWNHIRSNKPTYWKRTGLVLPAAPQPQDGSKEGP